MKDNQWKVKLAVILMSEEKVKVIENCEDRCYVQSLKFPGETLYTCYMCGHWKTVKDGDSNESK